MEKFKVINDPIHGSIPVPLLCMAIINTREFQRLRHLHQLGLSHLVYPGATHTRFEHSIGVCYLAGELVNTLRTSQEDLHITDKDVLCVMIAGLCHDLGHGPFSHVWEVYMGTEWKHEQVSVKIFEYLIKKNNLEEKFGELSLDKSHIEIIKNMILGKIMDPARAFLYQIVNNEDSGCDVDKWEYYLRDCHYLGLKTVFDYRRLILHMRVNRNQDDRMVLCFRDKEIPNMRDMFQTRLMLHRKAYQHRCVKVYEFMLIEILKQHRANKEWKDASNAAFEGKDFERYIKLTDSKIWNELRDDEDRRIAKLMKPLCTLNKKDGMFDVIENRINPEIPVNVKEFVKSCEEDFQCYLKKKKLRIKREDYDIKVISHHCGKDKDDPVTFVSFYSKTDPDKVFRPQGDPSKRYQEVWVRLIMKEARGDLEKAWKEYAKNQALPLQILVNWDTPVN